VEGDAVVSILGISRDITERVRAEEELQETRRMQALVADTVPDVLCVYDIPQDKVVYVNPHVVEILGYPSQEILGRGVARLQELVPAEDRKRVAQRYEQLVSAVEGDLVDVEHGVLHRTGEVRWLYSRAVVCHKTRDGHPDQILAVGQDITRRKRLEQLLQAQTIEIKDMPERLRKFRESLRMTQVEFGRLFAGASGPYNARQISSYETGDAVIPTELLLAIRAKGYPLEGVLGATPTSVVEKTVGYFANKQAEQDILCGLLEVLVQLAQRERATIAACLDDLHLPGKRLTRGQEKLLEEVRALVAETE
jgi:PAS domain S-box-containing protein